MINHQNLLNKLAIRKFMLKKDQKSYESLCIFVLIN